MKAIAEQKKLGHNICLSKGRKKCDKRKKYLCGKGFQCTVLSNLRGFNTKWDRTRDNAQDRQPELNLLLGNGKHTRRKGQENILSKREVSVDDRLKY